jgi:multidrug efflux pump subunit AcrA (membrane-fusion protein)
VLPGDPIVTFVAVNELTVEASVPPSANQWLKPGTQVLISNGENLEAGRASITSVGPVIDPNTGTRRVRAKVTSNTGKLSSGEFITVRFHTGS